MKILYLFRHGDAKEIGVNSDYSRELTEKGELRVTEMAKHLIKYGYRADLIITSGALRAKSTADIIAGISGYTGRDIVIENILYSSNIEDDVISLIKNISAKISSVMIVGHNPLLSDFVSYISRTTGEISMKKSSVIRIDFNTDDWSSIWPGAGNIKFYKYFKKGDIIDAAEDFLL